MRISRKVVISLLVLTVIVASSVGIYNKNHKVSLLTNDSVTFTGYTGYGEAEVKETVNKEMLETLLRKAGYSKDQTKYVMTLDDYEAEEVLQSESSEKYAKFAVWAEALETDISKTEYLKNGDKVTVTIENGGDKTNPIKEQKKTYKVSGLKKQVDKPISELFSKIDIEFSGVEGVGTAVNVGEYSDTAKLSKEYNLKSGDKITVKFPRNIVRTKKVNYVGENKKEFTVPKLYGANDITNLSAATSELKEQVWDDEQDMAVYLYQISPDSEDESSKAEYVLALIDESELDDTFQVMFPAPAVKLQEQGGKLTWDSSDDEVSQDIYSSDIGEYGIKVN